MYQPPKILRWLSPATYRLPQKAPTVYLTFDDGPNDISTNVILNILNKYNIKATFFCVGDNIKKFPIQFQMIKDNGHAIGNHTMHHTKGINSSTANYLKETIDCSKLTNSMLFRPPHGLITPLQNITLRNHGFNIIQWDVITYDWDKNHSTEKILRIIKKYTRNGSIIVMHDSKKASPRTLCMLEDAILWIKSQGYQFATL